MKSSSLSLFNNAVTFTLGEYIHDPAPMSIDSKSSIWYLLSINTHDFFILSAFLAVYMDGRSMQYCMVQTAALLRLKQGLHLFLLRTM